MNEFKVNFATGSTLNAIVLNAAGQVWNVNSSAWQALNLEGWQQFLVPLYPQAIPTLYYGDFPTAIVTQGVYTVQVYNAGEMPPDSLPLLMGEIGWNGLEEVGIDTLGAAGTVSTGETWSEGEKAQIRQALGVDGTKAPAAGGDLQSAMRRAFAALVAEFGIQSETDLAKLQQMLTATD